MRQAIVPPELAQAAADTGFSPAIRAGDFLFFTGATGGGLDGMPDDASQQMHNALDKVLSILNHQSAGPDAIVDLTSYHTDIATSFEPLQMALTDRLGTPLPAWTAVEVQGLRRPGAQIELRITAHVPEP